MKISQAGLDFITEFEGFYPKAYQDQAGIWTIGIGTIKRPDGTPIKKGDVCTKEQADNWLEFEVSEKCAYFNQVLGKINWQPSQSQYDALISFFYNVGIGKCYQGTTMGDAIYSKRPEIMAQAFLVYCKYTTSFLGISVKKISKGLLRRRNAEKDLFEGKN